MLVRHPVAGWLGHRNNPPMKMLKSGSCKNSALAQQKRERDKDRNVFGDNIEREKKREERKNEVYQSFWATKRKKEKVIVPMGGKMNDTLVLSYNLVD